MKKNEVKIGGLYQAKVSDKVVTVRIDTSHSKGGWIATNTQTGKRIHIKSAQRLRGPAESHKKQAETKEANVSTTTEAPDKSAGKKATTKKAKSTKASADKKPKKVSALDAAAKVLAEVGKPMRAQELIDAMAEQKLWKSPAGKTPAATLYAAMHREARTKGAESRFRKVDRGQFAINKEAK